jgi:hypothetical protein
MTWNYRIVKYKNPNHQDLAYGLHEIYYDELDRPRAMTTEATKLRWDLTGETPEEIVEVLEMMLKDAKVPFLNEEDIGIGEPYFGGE